MVLSGHPDSEARAEMLRITGLSSDRFETLYWTDRQAYDEGKLTGLRFWRNFVREAAIHLSESTIEELNRWDVRMWTTENPAMVAWQAALKQRGFLTAIVSNMGDSVLEYMETKFDWLARFDVLVWSFQLRVAKPDPEIYRYVLRKLGTKPEETLFIDDKRENVAAADDMGMKGIVFTTVDQLRADLIANRLEHELPLP
jgi:putative hydrolase of the HAD superfamily